MTSAARALGVLTAALLAVAGCSSSTSGKGTVGTSGAGSGGFPSSSSVASGGAAGSGSGSGGTSSGGASSGGASGGSAPSHATLAGVVLQAGDLPSSWTAKPSGGDGSNSDVSTELASCLGVDVGSLGPDKVDHADSDNYELGNSQVSSVASSYASQSSIDKRLAILQNPKAEGCLSTAFHDQLAKSLPAVAKVGDIPVRLAAQPAGLPASVREVATATTQLSVQGQTLSLEMRFAFISGHLLTASVSYVSVGAPVDDGVWTKAVTAVAGRVAAA